MQEERAPSDEGIRFATLMLELQVKNPEAAEVITLVMQVVVGDLKLRASHRRELVHRYRELGGSDNAAWQSHVDKLEPLLSGGAR